jgi:hypothetical protein
MVVKSKLMKSKIKPKLYDMFILVLEKIFLEGLECRWHIVPFSTNAFLSQEAAEKAALSWYFKNRVSKSKLLVVPHGTFDLRGHKFMYISLSETKIPQLLRFGNEVVCSNDFPGSKLIMNPPFVLAPSFCEACNVFKSAGISTKHIGRLADESIAENLPPYKLYSTYSDRDETCDGKVCKTLHFVEDDSSLFYQSAEVSLTASLLPKMRDHGSINYVVLPPGIPGTKPNIDLFIDLKRGWTRGVFTSEGFYAFANSFEEAAKNFEERGIKVKMIGKIGAPVFDFLN